MRIVSLLPAATDIVLALGLGEQLVGRTHECIGEGAELAAVPVLTETGLDGGLASRAVHDEVRARLHAGSSVFTLDRATLAALDPDLVLTQELCSVCALSYESLGGAVRRSGGRPTVLSLEGSTLEEVLASVLAVGAAAGVEARAAELHRRLLDRLAAVSAAVSGRGRPAVVTLEWLDPPWPVGHWVPDQVGKAGGEERLGRPGAHTDPVSWADVAAAEPQVILLAPCGIRLGDALAEATEVARRPEVLATPAGRRGEVYLIDGPRLVNCPSPRLVRGVEVIAGILHATSPLVASEARRLRP